MTDQQRRAIAHLAAIVRDIDQARRVTGPILDQLGHGDRDRSEAPLLVAARGVLLAFTPLLGDELDAEDRSLQGHG